MIYKEIFENINGVIDYLNNQGWSLSKTYFGNAPYQVMDYGNNRLIYYPQPIGVPLFRGQYEFHEPCIASFYRSYPNKIEKFIQNLKIEEYKIVTSKHPVIRAEIENGIFYDYVALAQHYGFKTKILDITNSLPVASFFAVTRKGPKGYMPIEKSDEPGVLYFISPSIQFMPHLENYEQEIYPIGWQVFKRPGKQRAFGINLKNSKNFNSTPGVFAFRFWQDKKISEQIYNVFHGGRDLFPKDIFAEKAAKIKESNIFSQTAFDNIDLTKEMILDELKKRNIKIQINSNLEYTHEDIAKIRKLSQSGKLTEDLTATTRLCYIPNKKRN